MAQLKSTNITGNLAVTGNILASKIIKLGGTADQILMADGSVIDKSTTVYTLPLAANGTRGGIQIGYTSTENNRAIELSSEKAYISLPTRLSHYKPGAENAPNTNGFYFFNDTTNESAKTAFDSSAQAATWVSAYSDIWAGQLGISYYSDNIAFRRKQNSSTWGNWIGIATKTWVEDKGYLTSHQSLADYVKGPSSSTDNAVARFNATTGKLIQNSGVTIDDSNNISTAGSLKLTNNGDVMWNSGSWWQRIKITDDSDANTNVFEFQQSSNSGSSWTSLFTILDNGNVKAKKFVTDGSSNQYVVLGDGSTKSLSDFGTGSGNVSGSGLTADYIVLGNGNSSIKISSNKVSDFVTLTGTQTITGTKTFDAPIKTTANCLGATASTLQYVLGIKAFANGGDMLWQDASAFVKNNMGFSLKTLSAKSHSGWTDVATDSKIVPTMSFIAYWNGAYSSGNASNLTYCANGTIIGTNNVSSAGNRASGKVVSAAAVGRIDSEKFAITSGATVKATYQYNSTDDCVELVWA